MTTTRRMPLGLQICNFKRLFLKANADRRDPYWEMDNIDWTILDSGGSYKANLQILENNYPDYSWGISEDIVGLNATAEIDEWKTRFDEWRSKIVGRTYARRAWRKEVVIETHAVKTKGRTYHYGRIQSIVPKQWVEQRARIYVYIAIPPEEREVLMGLRRQAQQRKTEK